jgi:hypothetical protein
MKVLAIGKLIKAMSAEERAAIMPEEVPATFNLYLGGKLEQFWAHDQKGPVFLLNVASVEEAKSVIGELPLTAQGYAAYEYFRLNPLAPLGLLTQGK